MAVIQYKKGINIMLFSPSFLSKTLAVLGLSGVLCQVHAAGISSDPGDYIGAPAGTQLALLYTQYLWADDFYKQGKKIGDDADFRAEIAMLRYVNFMQIGDWIVDPQIIVPIARQSMNGTETLIGVGDIILGGIAWPYRNDQDERYFGFGGFITVPVGSHEDQGFAVSNDRYQYNIQAGYYHNLNQKISLEGVVQAEFYDEQGYSQLEKDTFFQTDLSGIYKVNDKSNLALTWRYSDGGKEQISGLTTLEDEQRHTMIVSWSNQILPNTQLLLQWKQDLDVKNGLEMSGIQTRVLYAF